MSLTKQQIARRHDMAQAIAREAARDAGLPLADFLSPTREAAIARPRQDAMAIAHAKGLGFRVIGAAFNRDRATVRHGIRQSMQRAQEAN